jgi:hypothetical protein
VKILCGGVSGVPPLYTLHGNVREIGNSGVGAKSSELGGIRVEKIFGGAKGSSSGRTVRILGKWLVVSGWTDTDGVGVAVGLAGVLHRTSDHRVDVSGDLFPRPSDRLSLDPEPYLAHVHVRCVPPCLPAPTHWRLLPPSCAKERLVRG